LELSNKLIFMKIKFGGIVERTAELLKVKIEKEAAEEIAKRSRGTPRIANRLLKRVRDYCSGEW